MAKKSRSKKTSSDKDSKKGVALPDLKIERRGEWRFELPLSAIIEGKLPDGKKFQENVTLENISSGGAYFSLDSGVIVGSNLNLVIDVPSKLSKGKKLKLCLGGLTIRLEQPSKKGKKQGLALRFRKKFQFISEPEEKTKL